MRLRVKLVVVYRLDGAAFVDDIRLSTIQKPKEVLGDACTCADVHQPVMHDQHSHPLKMGQKLLLLNMQADFDAIDPHLLLFKAQWHMIHAYAGDPCDMAY